MQSNIRLPEVRGKYRFDIPLGKLCWFQVGGNADILFRPEDTADLANFLKNRPAHLPYFILGVGSNILIKDSGFKGVVIRLGRNFNYITHEHDTLTVGAATLDLNVALYTHEHSLTGLEFLAGIPGTIGGALAMNAGAYGADTSGILLEATAINANGEIRRFSPVEIGYYYRGKSLDDEWIFTEAKFRCTAGIQEEIGRKIAQIQSERSITQPIKSRTGGSTFKNPDGYKAWQLIDKAGCRGLIIGGAQISEMHCNFLINHNNATANDIESLITEVKKRVFNTTGIMLEEELRLVG